MQDIPLQRYRKGVFTDITGKVLTFILLTDTCIITHTGQKVAVYVKDFFSYHTIRLKYCDILLSPSQRRCSTEYRKI